MSSNTLHDPRRYGDGQHPLLSMTAAGRPAALRDALARRAEKEIRDISIEVGVTPRTHGSALFTRGQTQALSVAAVKP